MNVLWKLKRLGAMSAPEIWHRLDSAVKSKLEQAGFRLAIPGPPSGQCGSSWMDPIPTQFSPTPYIKAADNILAGQFSVFSMRHAQLGFPPLWNQDPLTRARAPVKFGKTIDYRNERVVGNIKYLWEINRHLELVTLAQAWHLSQEPRYAAGCKRLLESWFDQSPYPLGVNWASSLELGIRVVNWSFAWHLLGADGSPLFTGSAGATFRQRWLRSIYQHLHFIAGHKSRNSSANNHLLGELLGLVVGSISWPFWPETKQWCQQAHNEFAREVQLQNTADGVNREQAVWYHHAVIDMMLIAGLVGRANNHDFSEAFWDRLEAMMEYIASVMDVAGNVPCWGDSDDAVMVRFCPDPNFSVYRSILATGAVIFDRPDFKAKAGHFDGKSRWLLGDAAAGEFQGLSAVRSQIPLKRSFPEAGYYILGGDFETGDEVRIVADAGPLGYLSIAAHGHADALSFTLSVGGNAILIDPGTYAYHTQNIWREYFRGTSAHNTLRVDSLNQSVSAGSFLWTEHAQAVCVDFQCTPDYDRLIGQHDGYLRLLDPVRHRREILFDKQKGILEVHDEIRCRALHFIEIFWHFSEDCDVHLCDGFALARKKDVEIRLYWPSDASAEIVHGQITPPLGWSSRRFDEKHPSPTVVVCKRIKNDWIAHTGIQIVRTNYGK